jgi:acyl-coenzyme A synthetase/AMP-(fatty) acid ligase
VSDSDYYRTGDRVIVDGETLVHLGRLDRQAKVDGYRVELGEIEGTMREHPGVLDVAVVTTERRPGPGLALAAAVSGQGFENTDLQRFLRERLPGYMIPETMVPLAELPLNRSGKVDYLEVRRLLEEHQNA